jgi:hypothetical protein
MKLNVISAVVMSAVDITVSVATVGTATPALLAAKLFKATSKTVKYAKMLKAFKYTARFEQLLKLADVSAITAEFVHVIIDTVDYVQKDKWKELFKYLAKYIGITTASLLDPTGLSGIATSVAYPKCYKDKYYWFNIEKYAT